MVLMRSLFICRISFIIDNEYIYNIYQSSNHTTHDFLIEKKKRRVKKKISAIMWINYCTDQKIFIYTESKMNFGKCRKIKCLYGGCMQKDFVFYQKVQCTIVKAKIGKAIWRSYIYNLISIISFNSFLSCLFNMGIL